MHIFVCIFVHITAYVHTYIAYIHFACPLPPLSRWPSCYAHTTTWRASPPFPRMGGVWSLASCEGLPSSSISGSSPREGRGVVTACAGSCVRRRCWVPEGSGSVLLSCVCVLTRNYAATQRFHKLNIHSFMPERPHKRICPEITQYTFRCPCQNELAQRLRNTTFIVRWLPRFPGPRTDVASIQGSRSQASATTSGLPSPCVRERRAASSKTLRTCSNRGSRWAEPSRLPVPHFIVHKYHDSGKEIDITIGNVSMRWERNSAPDTSINTGPIAKSVLELRVLM
jgi:hypothetical protein